MLSYKRIKPFLETSKENKYNEFKQKMEVLARKLEIEKGLQGYFSEPETPIKKQVVENLLLVVDLLSFFTSVHSRLLDLDVTNFMKNIDWKAVSQLRIFLYKFSLESNTDVPERDLQSLDSDGMNAVYSGDIKDSKIEDILFWAKSMYDLSISILKKIEDPLVSEEDRKKLTKDLVTVNIDKIFSS